MNLKQLKELKSLNELDLLYKIIDIAKENFVDVETVIKQHKSKVAGIRVRSNILDIKILVDLIREGVLVRRGLLLRKGRPGVLANAITSEKEFQKKQKIKNEKNRRKRIAKFNEQT